MLSSEAVILCASLAQRFSQLGEDDEGFGDGRAGFIGSHVVEAYLAEGLDVAIVDDLSRGKMENVSPRAR